MHENNGLSSGIEWARRALVQISEGSNHVSSECGVDRLPMVLIGLCTCYKEDIRASAVELLYGRVLRILGEFFDHEDMPNDPRPFMELFRRLMQQVKPTPAAHYTRDKPFVFRDLYACMCTLCTYVFLRDDSAKRPLERLYTDLHRAVERVSDHVFTIEVNERYLSGMPAYFAVQQEEQTGLAQCNCRRNHSCREDPVPS